MLKDMLSRTKYQKSRFLILLLQWRTQEFLEGCDLKFFLYGRQNLGGVFLDFFWFFNTQISPLDTFLDVARNFSRGDFQDFFFQKP